MQPDFDPRTQRVASEVQRALATTLNREVSDPVASQVNVTEVRMSKDLSIAKVYYTVPKDVDQGAASNHLGKVKGFLRKRLADETRLRTVPQLRFVFDESLERGQRLEDLIDQAVASEANHDESDNDEARG